MKKEENKMIKRIDPFLYNAPSLDIHGFDRYGGVAMIKNFIDNVSEKAKNTNIKNKTWDGLALKVDKIIKNMV